MITYIKITGFKSFHNFEMTFTPLTVVAGTNASGKSNLFDALQLLARLAETDLKTAFNEQRGNARELFTQYNETDSATEMDFTVEMFVGRHVKDNWGGEAELNHTRLRYRLVIGLRMNDLGFDDLAVKAEYLEKIKAEQDDWRRQIVPKNGKSLWESRRAGGSSKPFIETKDTNGVLTIAMRQDGRQGGRATPANTVSQTVLSGVNSIDFPHVFAAKEEMRSWKFLRLNPEDLRQPTRQDVGSRDTITPGGKNLAAALYRIKQTDAYNIVAISRKLNSFLPNFTEVNVYDDKTEKQFVIKLKGDDGKEFSSRVLSEGTLRLLALCIMEYDEQFTGLLCFEEPENGIHPFRIKAMAQLLKDLTTDFTDLDTPLRQVIVNTHSTVLVSELRDWQGNKNVSIWFSRLSSLITDIVPGRRIKTKVTNMSPVHNDWSLHLSISGEEQKLTLAEVNQYLQTADIETALQGM